MPADFLQIANSVIKWNCRVLSVPAPSVQIVEPSQMATPTVKAAVSADGQRLLVSQAFADSDPAEVVVWLVLSHECRHIWQAVSADLFGGYRDSAALSVKVYNAQPAEVDAWAWAVVVLAEKFHARPTLEQNFGAELWQVIQDRARQIAAEGLF